MNHPATSPDPARHLLPAERPQPGLGGAAEPAVAAGRHLRGGVDRAHRRPVPVGPAPAAVVRRVPRGPRPGRRRAAADALADRVAAHSGGQTADRVSNTGDLDSVVAADRTSYDETRGSRVPRRSVSGPPAAPDVSVVVIGYNDRANLPQAIRSVLDQSLRNLEVLVVDDCSTDGSAEVAEEIAREDPRVTVVRLPENSGGCSKPRNVGIDRARAPYVMFLDSDDVYERHACKNLLLSAERTGADVVAGQVVRVNLTRDRRAALGQEAVHRPGGLPRRPREPDAVLRPALDQQDLPAGVPGPARHPVPGGRALRGLAVLDGGLLPGRDDRGHPERRLLLADRRGRRGGVDHPAAQRVRELPGPRSPCTG